MIFLLMLGNISPIFFVAVVIGVTEVFSYHYHDLFSSFQMILQFCFLPSFPSPVYELCVYVFNSYSVVL